MDHNHHNNNRVPRIHAFLSPTPPSPPMLSFIAALSITTLIFMCLYVLSPIVSVAILLALYITTLFLCRFMQDRRELRERTSFHAQTPQNNQRVVRVFNKLFWVVEEKRGGKRQQVKKLLGCVLCFGSQAMASSCVNLSLPRRFDAVYPHHTQPLSPPKQEQVDLEPDVIKRLPVVLHQALSTQNRATEETECCICLSAYVNVEKLKVF
ncbi:hypothetical protein D0Y65_034462 [Glycine soja]|uniref:Uncharacterized protein n=1 Tax=Glycine soja TaxID=3848 RepID=A0A445HQA3_GLYSO|nr:hypothetical protein D0Y65_034462 [Glycine soja]